MPSLYYNKNSRCISAFIFEEHVIEYFKIWCDDNMFPQEAELLIMLRTRGSVAQIEDIPTNFPLSIVYGMVIIELFNEPNINRLFLSFNHK